MQESVITVQFSVITLQFSVITVQFSVITVQFSVLSAQICNHYTNQIRVRDRLLENKTNMAAALHKVELCSGRKYGFYLFLKIKKTLSQTRLTKVTWLSEFSNRYPCKVRNN